MIENVDTLYEEQKLVEEPRKSVAKAIEDPPIL